MLKASSASGRGLALEKSFAAHERSFALHDLSCGSRVELLMKAFNSIGFSEASQTLIANTTGSGLLFPPPPVPALLAPLDASPPAPLLPAFVTTLPAVYTSARVSKKHSGCCV